MKKPLIVQTAEIVSASARFATLIKPRAMLACDAKKLIIGPAACPPACDNVLLVKG